jgi:hypothetical protein
MFVAESFDVRVAAYMHYNAMDGQCERVRLQWLIGIERFKVPQRKCCDAGDESRNLCKLRDVWDSMASILYL